mmetsp:Transcript_123562/g.357317  ORF Transcript_123562/g.357317 Transcript_123562/m.357317 type:complete len:235 (+) Transcript_123562:814-1518(+)
MQRAVAGQEQRLRRHDARAAFRDALLLPRRGRRGRRRVPGGPWRRGPKPLRPRRWGRGEHDGEILRHGAREHCGAARGSEPLPLARLGHGGGAAPDLPRGALLRDRHQVLRLHLGCPRAAEEPRAPERGPHHRRDHGAAPPDGPLRPPRRARGARHVVPVHGWDVHLRRRRLRSAALPPHDAGLRHRAAPTVAPQRQPPRVAASDVETLRAAALHLAAATVAVPWPARDDGRYR